MESHTFIPSRIISILNEQISICSSNVKSARKCRCDRTPTASDVEAQSAHCRTASIAYHTDIIYRLLGFPFGFVLFVSSSGALLRFFFHVISFAWALDVESPGCLLTLLDDEQKLLMCSDLVVGHVVAGDVGRWVGVPRTAEKSERVVHVLPRVLYNTFVHKNKIKDSKTRSKSGTVIRPRPITRKITRTKTGAEAGAGARTRTEVVGARTRSSYYKNETRKGRQRERHREWQHWSRNKICITRTRATTRTITRPRAKTRRRARRATAA